MSPLKSSKTFPCNPVIYTFHNMILQDHVLCCHVAMIFEPEASRYLLPFAVYTEALDFGERRRACKKYKSL